MIALTKNLILQMGSLQNFLQREKQLHCYSEHPLQLITSLSFSFTRVMLVKQIL